MLRDLGCTEMQGFLFSRPLPVEQIRTLLRLRTKKVAAA
jgi:EAL domain-containing protein (putative c-di-GMP-specific phosphodiesterase class I)